MDCPSCGGSNSFSASKKNGKVLYRCFRASCKLSGASDYTLSINDLRGFHEIRSTDKVAFIEPDYWLPVFGHSPSLDFLKKNNCLDVLDNHPTVKLRYDPRQDRVVFISMKDGLVANATGKALTKATKPKWMKYGGLVDYFLCDCVDPISLGLHAIVVEDAASACAVWRYGTGISLNGTYLTTNALSNLQVFKTATVALDFDATRKAVEIASTLYPFVRTKVSILRKDLKYCSQEELKEYV